jgi:serine protease
VEVVLLRKNVRTSLGLAVAASLLSACTGGGASAPGIPAQVHAAGAESPLTVHRNGLTIHLFPVRHSDAAAFAASSTNNLIYNGGPIQPAPKMYLIEWGTWTASSGDPDGEGAVLQKFLQGVGGSKWLNTVTQYTQSGGTAVGNPSGNLAGVWNDTSAPPIVMQDSDIGNEALKAAAHFNDYSVNASYVIATPHLHNDLGFAVEYCAWHSSEQASNGSTISFTNLPYIPDAGSSCGQGSVNTPGTLDGVSIVEGHEQGETETDPQPSSGWIDSSGNEIGDKCAWTGLQNTAFSTGTFPTQPLWSNASSSCVQSY